MQESKPASVDLAASDDERALRAASEPSGVGSEQHAHGALPPLEPCPFCGGQAMTADIRTNADPSLHTVECPTCAASTGLWRALPEAIAAWNRRTSCSQVAVPEGMALWQPIETAPKNGTEILVWREDCGAFMAKWTCVNDLRTTSDKDRDELDEESLFSWDWFGGDSEGSFRADGSEVPTHWMPVPADPPRFAKTYCSQCGGEFGPGNAGFSHCEDHAAALPGSAGVLPNDAAPKGNQ